MSSKVRVLKGLTIELSADHRPSFVFTGEWGGKDIDLVMRLLKREYRLKQRSVRRTDTPKEVTNERA